MSTNIYIGQDKNNPLFSFNDDTILSVSANTSVDPIQNELSSDTATFTVLFDDENEELRSIEWATPIEIYYNSDLVGKFYFTSIKRIGRQTYEINATSVVGLMDYDTFYGGIYSGESFESIVRQIVLTNGFTYRGVCLTLRRGLYGDVTYDGSDATNFCALPFNRFQQEIMKYACLNAEFRLHKCILNDLEVDPFPLKTSVRLSLLGEVASEELQAKATTKANVLKNRNFGIYMTMTRDNTSSPWGDYGEVVFAYGNQIFSLGTPTEPTSYAVSINSDTKRATINGTTYVLTYDTASIPDWAANVGIRYYGGGVESDLDGSENYIRYTKPVYCDIEYGNYESYISVSGALGDFQRVEVKQTLDGEIYLYTRDENGDASPSENPFGWAKPGEFFEIQKAQQQYQLDFISDADFGFVQAVKIYGWIPICTKREALHQVLFASGISILKGGNGEIIFSGVSEDEIPISENNVFLGGSSEKQEKVNTLEITEHAFIYNSSSDLESIYEIDSNSTSGVFVGKYTQQPVYEKTKPDISNGKIIVTKPDIVIYDYNCNACVFTGSGTIKQKVYKHIKKTITRNLQNYVDGKTISSDACSLITAQNSEFILDVLESYYTSDSVDKMDIGFNGEKSGFKYNYLNSFGETKSGLLTKMTKVFSNIVKASCEFVSGFLPPQPGGGFSQYVVLTGTGTWNVPESVYEKENPRIRIVAIGGGNGGDSGFAGKNGLVTPAGGDGTPGQDGGLGGNPGVGGRVYEITVNNPSSSYSFVCGIGGEGGAICTSSETANAGSNGTASSITDGINTYSSASGSVMENGYLNILSGRVLAKPWIPVGWNDGTYSIGMGGTGGNVQVFEYNGKKYLFKSPGRNVYPINGTQEEPGYGGESGQDVMQSGAAVATGGGGGGGAIGGMAQNGTNASISGSRHRAGNGGKGADAMAIPPKATDYNENYYGYGGCGGYGGGGGGCSGYAPSGGYEGTAGVGGYGGKGGTGGDGCIIVYY